MFNRVFFFNPRPIESSKLTSYSQKPRDSFDEKGGAEIGWCLLRQSWSVTELRAVRGTD